MWLCCARSVRVQFLRRPWLALLYACTFGCFFVGWLSDAFLLPSLVPASSVPSRRPHSSEQQPRSPPGVSKDMSTLLKLYCTVGLFGGHRLYTREPLIALLYSATFGLLGLGWLSDAFQLAYLLDRANHPRAYERYSLFTAYQLLLPPFGLLGLPHFYLGNRERGWWFAATAGLLGLGVLHDVFTLPTQVREANEAYAEAQTDDDVTDADSTAGHPSPYRQRAPGLPSGHRAGRDGVGAAVYGPPRCVACMQAAINTVFLDCGHSVFCIDCAKTFVDFARDSDAAADSGGVSSSRGTRGGSSGSGTPLMSTGTLSLPCAICRHDIREIKQIYTST